MTPTKSGGEIGHEIRVSVIGVGSAASGMIQAAQLYRQGAGLGILHPVMSVYSPSDIEVVAAFDVDRKKVGKKLSEALFANPESLPKYVDVRTNVVVEPGIIVEKLDADALETLSSDFETVSERLKATGCDVVVNTINGGQSEATLMYAKAALAAGAAFVNATPDPVATNVEAERMFSEAKLPLLGDDLLSQVGGTALHAYLLQFLNSRGVRVKQTYQLDVGGGLENRLTVKNDLLRNNKRAIKTMTVQSALPYAVNVVSGTTEYVDFMGNSRDTHFELVGESTLGAPIEVEVTLKSTDGANAAGPLLDAVRAARIAKDKGLGGAIEEVNPYLFKLVRSVADPISAEKKFVEFVAKNSR
ncbi:MAG: L-myo-inositol-1-phosphate synthase [Thermoprotei archaeon]